MYVIEQAERSVEDRPERYGPAQQHRRQLASLNKQITQKTNELAEVMRIPHIANITVIISSVCFFLHCFLLYFSCNPNSRRPEWHVRMLKSN